MSETAAIYHTHKHYRELPEARKTKPEFNAYFKAAQDTIQNSAQSPAQVESSAMQRGGMMSYAFKLSEGGQEMTAIVFVSDDGGVFLATLIP